MELVEILLSSGLCSGLMAVLLAWFQRKWKHQDGRDSRLTALVEANKVLMIDRVRHLGAGYLREGEITLEDKETLKEMYAAYKALGGNGHLVTIMAEVEKLKVVAK